MQFLNNKVTLHCGDCLDVLATLPENSLDSCVTDPPYGLQFMGREWDKLWRNETEADAAYVERTNGELTSRARKLPDYKATNPQQMQDWHAAWARQVYRVLKPGAHLLAFGGTRTYHRMACAIEDAGFEIRDQIQWLYGSGFPKSHDVSKGIDKAAGVQFEALPASGVTTDAARQWQGWGTALKPANEPIVLARKPLSEKTVAANVLKWGTGAINVDGCRVEGAFKSGWSESGSKAGENACMSGPNYARDPKPDNAQGRWPANVIHDGSEEVVRAFPEGRSAYGNQASADAAIGKPYNAMNYIYGESNERLSGQSFSDQGSAARFFYTAKADSDDRLGSKHPTVKPLDLMQYLVRLITPKGGTVLDPFAGTGTTGEAAWRECIKAVLIEREPEYQQDVYRRMTLCLSGSDERTRESIKAKNKDKPIDHGPLFNAG